MADEPRFTVCVVDDDELTRKTLRRILEHDGYRVETAKSIAECAAKVHQVQPFAILLDRRLDDGTAEEVIPELRRLAPQSRIVIATGFADLESSIEALRLGAADYLVKPVNPEVLQGCLLRLRNEMETEQALGSVQNELKETAERLELVIRATREAIWDVDLVSGAVWWSDQYNKTFGARPAETSDSQEWWEEHLHPEDRERVTSSFKAAIEGSDALWRSEYRYLRTDGSVADVIDRGFIARDDSGIAVRMIGAMSDVTDRKRLEAEFLQAQKMEAVGRLAGGVAHDFNNLLAGIVSSCRVVSRMLEENSAAERSAALELLAHMQQSAMRGASMTRQLLDFSRVRPREKAQVDVSQIIAEAAEMLPAILGEDIELVVVSGVVEAPIEADAGLLEQIVMNLAVNSRDAMPEGGRLELRVSMVVLDDAAAPGSLGPGEYVLLEAIDTGCGMSEEAKRKAFEPFFTTKPRGKGTGLGLATVFGLVHDFGGAIEVQSEVGRGTAFKLYFPRSRNVQASRAAEVPRTNAPHGSGTILLVEDESLVRAATRLQLTALGYEVLEAESPEAALGLLAAEDVKIDLLLSDIVMPGMSGPELARRIAVSRPTMRVLFMSGYSDEALVEQGRVEAGVPVLEKPFEEEDLIARVQEVLAFRVEHRA